MTASTTVLTDTLFDAYGEEKWASNVHNLARMRVKERLLAICSEAQKGLEEELADLERAASDEVPNLTNQKRVDAQWIYWFRDAKARLSLASFLEKTPLNQSALLNIAPQDKHAVLAVVLRHEALWVGLRVPSGAVVDRKNLVAMLSKSWKREELLDLLKGLPPEASFERTSGAIPVEDVTPDLLAQWGEEIGSGDPEWRLGCNLTAAEAIELGEELVDHIRRWLGAITPFYRFAAWSRDNEHVDVSKKIEEHKEQKRRQAKSFGVGDKVRVVSGFFAGKLGTVQAIDTRGQVKVRVSKMSVVIKGNDLVPAD